MRKRKSVKAQDRDHRHITREIQREARLAREKPLREALALCLAEIEQFHHAAYPDCDGGCPAHEAMDAARKALGEKT